MLPTPFPELNDVLGKLVSRMRAILGSELIGAYLQGSLAVGDFDEHSDVDFIVAIEAELEPQLVEALQAMHGKVHELESKWARHLEGSYFPRDVLRQPPVPGSKLWYLDNGARQLIRSDHCNTLVVRRVVRDKGIALSGPSPDILVGTVSDELLRAEIYETLTRWGREILGDPAPYRNRFYQGFIVLSYCRMLHDLRSGRPGSKREGAEWAKSALDPSWASVIDSAWSTRPDPARSVHAPADAEAFERTLRFVEYVIREAETMFSALSVPRSARRANHGS
jgi:predicted nucleotidyltransferase